MYSSDTARRDARLSVTIHQIGGSHILLLYDLAVRRSHVVVRPNVQADSDVMLFIAFRTQEDHPRVYKRILPLCVAAPLLWLPGNSQQPPSTIDRLGTNHDANERRGCG